jgi:hypothetical protein
MGSLIDGQGLGDLAILGIAGGIEQSRGVASVSDFPEKDV